MKKNLEIKTIEHKGINVTIHVDYDNDHVSLVENINHNYIGKKYLFANRGLGYMNGWLTTLEAMTEAIKVGKKRPRSKTY